MKVEDPIDNAGKPLYNFTREEDINIGNGDAFVPQAAPPACAGDLHQVDVADDGTDGYPATTVPDPSGTGGPAITVPASDPITNPTFVDIGGSPFEGMAKPTCDMKLVPLNNGKSIVPTFNVFTDVNLPTRLWEIVIDDVNFSTDPRATNFGGKTGVPFSPVGVYDFDNRLVTTVETDFNGLADILLPSTNRINCPTPSGVCQNVYRLVANDPGVPGALNTNYDPQFRTIAANFEATPGVSIISDHAPTQVGVVVQLPGTQSHVSVKCPVNDPAVAQAATPELYAVTKPYTDLRTAGTHIFSIEGTGFGAATGQVLLDGTTALPTTSWSDSHIDVTVPASTAVGARQLSIVRANGVGTLNGLTFHVLGGAYTPNVYEVGPGLNGPRQFNATQFDADNPPHPIQAAVDAAQASAGNDLIVVYPGPYTTNPRINPRGAYYENLIVTSPVKLQGVGPGSPDGSIRGSVIDGSAFAGDSAVATDWAAKINTLTTGGVPDWLGNSTINSGEVIYYLAMSQNAYGSSFRAAVDGFDIRGGDQQGVAPGAIAAAEVVQGGAIYANAYIRNLRVSNNIVQNNGGAFGTIRIGTPAITTNGGSENDNVQITHNRIIANAGTNLAGGIGLFAGSDNYDVSYNDICGNFSAEYGGGLSVYGLSPNGAIHHNRVYYNDSYDEGAGIMIAGQLPVNPSGLSPGSGAVDIHDNVILGNLASDDGGGLRFLMAGNAPMNVYNNMITDNVSAHEGGGIALDDATNVRIYHNTIAENLTTATAVTSNGSPAPAGLSTAANSAALQASLPASAAHFSNPVLFNNIFWNNRAGTFNAATATISGIGLGGVGDIDHWDMGAQDLSGSLSPTNSVLQTTTHTGSIASPTNSFANPNFVSPYEVSVTVNPWRQFPVFVGAYIVGVDLPPSLLGDFHIQSGSAAQNLGASSKSGVNIPNADIDGQPRLATNACRPDAGADEIHVAGCDLADLSITKTDGQSFTVQGAPISYTVVAQNAGPSSVTGATVTDSVPAGVTGATWTCTATAGSSCPASGNGNISTTAVNLASGGSATFILNGTVSPTASGTITNIATIASSVADPVASNNSASDADTVRRALPTLTLLDNFNRANANSLGANWSQANTGANVDIRVNANQAFANQNNDGAQAMWNIPTTGFGANQGASMVLATTGGANNRDDSALILKGTAGTATNPNSFIRVRFEASGTDRVLVETTTNGGGAYTLRATFNQTLAAGDVLTAAAYADGSVTVWVTSGTTTTWLGSVQLPTTGGNAFTTGTGRIGIQLPTVNARADDLRGGNA